MFSIGDAERITGLSSRQIRYYEQEGLIHVRRSIGGQRRFRQADIEKLLKIKALMDRERTVEGVKKFLDQEQRPDDPKQKEWDRARLTSLYPVSDRRQLLQALQTIKVPKPKKD